MSPAVIHGMLAGIGVLIFASQFHVMLDDKPKQSGLANLLSIPQAIVGGIFPIDGSKHELAAVTGILTIVTLIAWNKWKPLKLGLVPGALLAVVLATTVAYVSGGPYSALRSRRIFWRLSGSHPSIRWGSWLTSPFWISAGDGLYRER